ncbi:MAG: hypothetical protein QOG87_1533, partial [Actinomycetota bacterium]
MIGVMGMRSRHRGDRQLERLVAEAFGGSTRAAVELGRMWDSGEAAGPLLDRYLQGGVDAAVLRGWTSAELVRIVAKRIDGGARTLLEAVT